MGHAHTDLEITGTDVQLSKTGATLLKNRGHTYKYGKFTHGHGDKIRE